MTDHGDEYLPGDHPSMFCDRCFTYHSGDCPDDDEADDYPEGMGHRQDTWPDLDEECERHIKAAFATLGRAPGYRQTYERTQQALAHAVRILRGLPE